MYIRQVGGWRRGSRRVLLLHNLQRGHPWMVTAVASVIQWLDYRGLIFGDTLIFAGWIRAWLRPAVIGRHGVWSWHFLSAFTMDTTVLSGVRLKSFGGKAQIPRESALCRSTSSSCFYCEQKQWENIMIDDTALRISLPVSGIFMSTFCTRCSISLYR